MWDVGAGSAGCAKYGVRHQFLAFVSYSCCASRVVRDYPRSYRQNKFVVATNRDVQVPSARFFLHLDVCPCLHDDEGLYQSATNIKMNSLCALQRGGGAYYYCCCYVVDGNRCTRPLGDDWSRSRALNPENEAEIIEINLRLVSTLTRPHNDSTICVNISYKTEDRSVNPMI